MAAAAGNHVHRIELVGLATLASLAVACSEPLMPRIGDVRLTVATTGADLDPDGYSVVLDGGAGLAVAVNDSRIISGLSAEGHSVLLKGLAPNCHVGGTNPRDINVVSHETTQVSFTVACFALGPVDISGVWDFTEHWNASTCDDIGSYSFTQTGDTFVGTAIVSPTGCGYWAHIADSVHGRVVGSSVTFHGITGSCATDHTANVSGDPPSQMSGTGTCQDGFPHQVSSTWHAVHHAAVGSVTVVSSPEILPVGATSLVWALVHDTAGHPVFFRTAAWSSANEAVATARGTEAGYVEPTGMLQGVSPGSATITATVEGRSGSASVTVIPWDISGTWAITETISFECDSFGCGQCSDSGSVVLSQDGSALSGTISVAGSCFQNSYGVSGDASLPPGLAFGGAANGHTCRYSGALGLHRPLRIDGEFVCSVGDEIWSGWWQAVLVGQPAGSQP